MRRLEKRVCRQTWQEDREDRVRRPAPKVLKQPTPQPRPSTSPDRRHSSAGSRGDELSDSNGKPPAQASHRHEQGA